MDYWAIFTNILYILNLLFILFLVFVDDKSPRSTLIWIMVALFLPGIGIIFYILIGQDFRKQRLFDIKEDQDRKLKNVAQKQLDSIESDEFFFKNPKTNKYKKLITINLNSDDAIFTQDNEIEQFYWGEDKFGSLLNDIYNAKESIDIEYYIFKYDEIGKKIIDALEDRLDHGVKVRLLVDGLGGRFLKRKRGALDKFLEKGGEFAVFFPSFLNINLRLNYRNHRKIVIIDDKIGYIGGFNVGDDIAGQCESQPIG